MLTSRQLLGFSYFLTLLKTVCKGDGEKDNGGKMSLNEALHVGEGVTGKRNDYGSHVTLMLKRFILILFWVYFYSFFKAHGVYDSE